MRIYIAQLLIYIFESGVINLAGLPASNFPPPEAFSPTCSMKDATRGESETRSGVVNGHGFM